MALSLKSRRSCIKSIVTDSTPLAPPPPPGAGHNLKERKMKTQPSAIDETLTVGTSVTGNYMGQYPFAGVVKTYRFCDARICYTVELTVPMVMFGLARTEVSIDAGTNGGPANCRCSLAKA